MKAKDNLRTAAEVLVDQLIVNGVRHAFCVPGESYAPPHWSCAAQPAKRPR
jgi:thiamine pyrophosphate-dependent acetolactate synthase large subunit-like protein